MNKLINWQQKLSESIDECINEIDWNKIHKVMILLDWVWAGEGVPSVDRLKQFTRKQLEDTIIRGMTNQTDMYVFCGGIKTSYRHYNDNNEISIEFILESWENEI